MDHMAAIKSGEVTKSNVIGLRKAINANARREQRLSTSSTCPKLTGEQVEALEAALLKHKPRVVGELHDSGLKLLRSPRYKKRLADVRPIIDSLQSFHLVSFDRTGDHGLQSHPVYMARGKAGSFLFRNIPWQSHGNGPEVINDRVTDDDAIGCTSCGADSVIAGTCTECGQ